MIKYRHEQYKKARERCAHCMGIYVNPGNISFKKAVNSKIYIDKTELIASVNDRIGTSDCFLCVSRPRRFGKSMAADMLAAYYGRDCDSAEL